MPFLITSILGWWGIPWAFISNIKGIKENYKGKKAHHDELGNDYLRILVD